MNTREKHATPRREFMKTTGRVAAGLALAGISVPRVHAGEDNTIQLALIGCGGRGSGAVANAMSAGGLVLGDDSGTNRPQGSAAGGPIKLVAMADLRQDRLDGGTQRVEPIAGRARSTRRRSDDSSVSTLTATRSIACARATWRS